MRRPASADPSARGATTARFIDALQVRPISVSTTLGCEISRTHYHRPHLLPRQSAPCYPRRGAATDARLAMEFAREQAGEDAVVKLAGRPRRRAAPLRRRTCT